MRPWAIQRRAEDYVAVLRARSSCGSGGKPRKASILPSNEQFSGLTDGSVTSDVLVRIEPDLGDHQPEQRRRGDLATNGPALQIGNRSDTFPANNSKQPTWTPAAQ